MWKRFPDGGYLRKARPSRPRRTARHSSPPEPMRRKMEPLPVAALLDAQLWPLAPADVTLPAACRCSGMSSLRLRGLFSFGLLAAGCALLVGAGCGSSQQAPGTASAGSGKLGTVSAGAGGSGMGSADTHSASGNAGEQATPAAQLSGVVAGYIQGATLPTIVKGAGDTSGTTSPLRAISPSPRAPTPVTT
jgi:hypothetical protein